jgi:1,5-anhydro-D-fructose reductase (1,5-anhydro-D-mannitol-forming)
MVEPRGSQMTIQLGRGPAPYAIGAESLGWGLCGASTASAHIIPAIRAQTAQPERSAIADAWVTALHSHSLWRARQFADRHAIPHALTDLQELLARHDVRIVYVGNHPRHHASTVLAALRAGKHVLCEPPLALSEEEARFLAASATDRGLILAVNYHNRGDAAIQHVWQMIGNGDIGDILGGRIRNAVLLGVPQQTWRLQSLGGGVLLDRTLHSFDLLRFLCTDEIAEVFAMAGPNILGREVEEDVLTNVRMRRSGAVFHLHDSFTLPHAPTSVEIYGTAAVLAASHCLDEEMSTLRVWRGKIAYERPLAPVNSLTASVAAMVTAVRGYGQPLANAEDGITSLKAALITRQSLQRGVRVAV